MIRTLYWYVTKELLRVAGLALLALTLLMTVFAVAEPLRKEGLAPRHVTKLFIYMMPPMLSLTLPIATLFAATFVYGRLSQDNELTACRASGISTISLLKPAMVIGAVVTVLSLVLGNFVTPRMVKHAEVAVKANIMGIFAQHLRTRNFYQKGNYVIHADSVSQQGDTLVLQGVVACDNKKPKDIRLVSATTAYAKFTTQHHETYLTIFLINPVGTRTGSRAVLQETSHPWEPLLLDPLVKEKPEWYDWGRLIDTLENPEKNADIARLLAKMGIEIGHQLLGSEVADVINSGQAYDKLRQGDVVYRIRAERAVLEGSTVRLSSQPGPGGQARPVEVTILRNGEPRKVITADTGTVKSTRGALTSSSFATIELDSPVTVRWSAEREPDLRRERWVIGQLPLPERITKMFKVKGLADFQERLKQIDTADAYRGRLEAAVLRLRHDIVAEMHGRVAYGLSCFLLVSMGAALGLIFRGGQFISALTLCVVPATIVLVMIIMGKQMVTNPDVSVALGLGAIWAGIVLMAAANAVVYLYLMRR